MNLPSKADTDEHGNWLKPATDQSVLHALRMNMTAKKVFSVGISTPAYETAIEAVEKNKGKVAETMVVLAQAKKTRSSGTICPEESIPDAAKIGLSSFYS